MATAKERLEQLRQGRKGSVGVQGNSSKIRTETAQQRLDRLRQDNFTEPVQEPVMEEPNPRTFLQNLQEAGSRTLDLAAVPFQATGEAVRTAREGLPFRLPDAAAQFGINADNRFITSKEQPADILEEAVGGIQGISAGVTAPFRGLGLLQTASQEVRRPKDRLSDTALQVLLGGLAAAAKNPSAPLKAAKDITNTAGKSLRRTSLFAPSGKTAAKNIEKTLPTDFTKVASAADEAIQNLRGPVGQSVLQTAQSIRQFGDDALKVLPQLDDLIQNRAVAKEILNRGAKGQLESAAKKIVDTTTQAIKKISPEAKQALAEGVASFRRPKAAKAVKDTVVKTLKGGAKFGAKATGLSILGKALGIF